MSLREPGERNFNAVSHEPTRAPIQSVFESWRLVGYPGGTLGISGWGCAAGTLEPLAYTRASLAEFCYPILE